eukprot:Nitzschia sp. Nitz4//scaffold8_size234185//86340//87036//NITZ4_001253-RA/size234185-augustus-gene-0.261-mRNA-1//-1//CDS//3329559794//5340//frame0
MTHYKAFFVALLALVAGAFAENPENDECIWRTKLSPYEPVNGDLSLANYDYNNQGVCGSRSDRPAVWYEVRGRDADVTVMVCTNNDVITEFGVFPDCNSRDCTASHPQTYEPALCELGEWVNVTFFAEDNEQYFVHVRSDVANGVGSNFTIMYEDSSLDGPVTDAPTKAPTSSTGVIGGDDSDGSTANVVVSFLALASAALTVFVL